MSSIHIIGAGGIGSYFCRDLHSLIKNNQLSLTKEQYIISIYDPDDIEQKNLPYQDYNTTELFENKAEVLAARYKIIGHNIKVETVKGLARTDQDIFCICVDNAESRVKFFTELSTMPNPWIDMRSQGRHIALYTKSEKNTLEFMLSTLPNKTEEGAGSCQLKHELDIGKIQLGNRIIAEIGLQALLNIHRKEPMTSRFVHEF
jgi:hypothetical protein